MGEVRFSVAVRVAGLLAVALAGCDFTGLPEDRAVFTRFDAADVGGLDAAGSADASIPSESGPPADAAPPIDACEPETTGALEAQQCGVGACGTKTVKDRCGNDRFVSCASTCPGTGQTCGGGAPGVPNVCGCTPETAAAICARLGKNCGTLSATDNCGEVRVGLDCGACASPLSCGGGGAPIANVCGCTPESEGSLADRLCRNVQGQADRVCGNVQGADNCGATRTVSCGACGPNDSCSAAGQCTCVGETTARLVSDNCGASSCGDKSVIDRCGATRTISCGTTCSGTGRTCGGGTPPQANVCGCTPESNARFCERRGANCGSVTAADNCGDARTVSCGGCTAPQSCGGGGFGGVCGCTPTTCGALGKNCGTVADGCGGFLACGSCSGVGQSCGGAGVANVCGCTAESNASLAQRACGSRVCGASQGTDNCGQARTVSCGACASGYACNAGGTCDCVPETPQALTTARCGSGSCGTKAVTDFCGQPRTVDCGATCSGVNTCGGGGQANVCGCTPATCGSLGKNCGSVSDGCGGTLACGSCAGANTCGGGNPGVANVCGCTPEGDLAFCTRVGAECGATTATDNCGVQRSVASCGTCVSGMACSAGTCVDTGNTVTAVTAAFTGPGLDTCGASTNESCARSLLVPAGTFFRGTGTQSPATVSSFRLDKYEVSVGRFRKFVQAWVTDGWRPSAGAGKHAHLNGGAGLAKSGGGSEDGWDPAWLASMGRTYTYDANGPIFSGATPATVDDWTYALSCASGFQTWSASAGSKESYAINCVNWYELYAFCIWDGGFLPTEAEWEYAAAGGAQERLYAWGSATPDVSRGYTYSQGLLPLGWKPLGNGRWGQSDFIGSTTEWVLDLYQATFATPSVDGVALGAGSDRVTRGNTHAMSSTLEAQSAHRWDGTPPFWRNVSGGGRCARVP